MLARSLLYMQPREGRRDELIALFERLGVPERALQQDGCLSVELQVAPEESAPVLVTALWSHRDAYDGWLANPWRESVGPELEALLTDPPGEGTVYDIRLAAGGTNP
jgi:quinol monooxygenase YgiN